MEQFDFHRFVLALKCHFVTTRGTWLRVFSLQFIALFLWQLFFLWSSFYSRNYTDESAEVVHSIYYNAIDQIAGFSIVFIGIAMLFGAVCMFTGLKSTGARAAYLTLPLANAEKYVVNFLFATLFCALGSFVAYLCADALRVLIDLLTGHMVVWSVPYFFDSWTLLTIDNYLTVPLIGFFLLVHAFYMLGGTLLRRQPILLTAMAHVILVYVLIFVWRFGLGYPSMLSQTDTGEVVPTGWYYAVTIGFYLLSVLFYWLSYRIFCRMQVNNHKWLNV